MTELLDVSNPAASAFRPVSSRLKAKGSAPGGALFGIVRPDGALLALFSGGLVLVALVAGWVPAHRAAALDPVAALRAD